MKKLFFRSLTTFVFLAFITAARAVSFGTYTLDNHPNGNQSAPLYGLRLDGLLGGSAVYTFDVTNRGMGNGLTLTYSAAGIHIFGNIWGGQDIGPSWSNPELWTVDFTFSNVTQVPGDDDAWTLNTNKNVSSTPFGLGILTRVGTNESWDLRDQSNGAYSFRFGDENNDAGHRNFSGLSGWGWLDFRPTGTTTWQHVGSDDWLFTAQAVPEGGLFGADAVIAGLGLFCLAAFFHRRGETCRAS